MLVQMLKKEITLKGKSELQNLQFIFVFTTIIINNGVCIKKIMAMKKKCYSQPFLKTSI